MTTIGICAPATATTPTLVWAEARQLNILCNVAGGPGIDYLALTTQLCRDVKRLAEPNAPYPVTTIPIGDPAVLDSNSVTLIVHASVTPAPQGRLMSFSMRPFRNQAEASVLFGAAPRVAAIPAANGSSPELDAAVAAALSETLPWLAPTKGARPIANRN